MKQIFASAKNNLLHNDEHYVRFEFVAKYMKPIQLLQMGIDDFAEYLESAQQSVQRTGGTRRKIRHSSKYVGGKHARR